MRKGLISPGVLIAGFALLAIVLLYGDRGPEGRHPSSAIPEPSDGALFLYFEGKNASAFLPLPRTAAKIGGRRARSMEALDALSPLFQRTGETAALLSGEENAVHVFMAARLPLESTRVIAEGDFPGDVARELRHITLQESSSDVFQVYRNGEPLPLHIRVKGGFTLFASSLDTMERMTLALEQQVRSIDAVLKIEQRWPNHLLFSDGGLLSGVASMEGLPATKGNLVVE